VASQPDEDKRPMQPDTRDEDRERQRMMLVDGFPGEWEWDRSVYAWHLSLRDSLVGVDAEVCKQGDGWTGVPVLSRAAKLVVEDSRVYGETPYEVARALKPKAERLVACLEGLSGE
jgi:hypothetical protein